MPKTERFPTARLANVAAASGVSEHDVAAVFNALIAEIGRSRGRRRGKGHDSRRGEDREEDGPCLPDLAPPASTSQWSGRFFPAPTTSVSKVSTRTSDPRL